MPRGRRSSYREPLGPVYWVTKDAQDHPRQAGQAETIEEAWPQAERLLQDTNITRVVLYEYARPHTFRWVNALSRPGFLRHDPDPVTEVIRELLMAQVQTVHH